MKKETISYLSRTVFPHTNFEKTEEINERFDYIPVREESFSMFTDKEVRPSVAYTHYDKEAMENVIVAEEHLPAVRIHECGHVILQHNKSRNLKEKLSANMFEDIYKKVAHLNEGDFNDEDYKKGMFHHFLNVAMDFEVNSKFFVNDEERQALHDEITTYTAIQKAIETEADSHYSPTDLANAIRSSVEADKEKPNVLFPVDYDFPDGLDFVYYLSRIANDPEKFLEKEDDNQNGGSGSGNGGKGKTEAQRKKAIKNAIKKAMKEYMEKADKAENGEGNSIDEAIAQFSEEISNESNEDNTEGPDTKMNRSATSKGNRNHGGGHNEGTVEGEGTLWPDLGEAIKHVTWSKIIRHRSDLLYNYNRGKCPDGTIREKSVTYEIPNRPNVYILFDCSGSMNPQYLKDTIEELKAMKSKFGRKSKIVCWDTQLCQEVLWRDIDSMVYSAGGGNALARGIKYINEGGITQKDTFIIISDFYDENEEMAKELEKLNTKHILLIETQYNDWYGAKDITSLDCYKPYQKVQIDASSR